MLETVAEVCLLGPTLLGASDAMFSQVKGVWEMVPCVCVVFACSYKALEGGNSPKASFAAKHLAFVRESFLCALNRSETMPGNALQCACVKESMGCLEGAFKGAKGV